MRQPGEDAQAVRPQESWSGAPRQVVPCARHYWSCQRWIMLHTRLLKVRTFTKNRSTRRPVFGGYKHGDPGRTDRERTSLRGSAVVSGTGRQRQYRARIVAVLGVLSQAFRSWTAVRTLRRSSPEANPARLEFTLWSKNNEIETTFAVISW
jgi:hypothetical protein